MENLLTVIATALLTTPGALPIPEGADPIAYIEAECSVVKSQLSGQYTPIKILDPYVTWSL